MKTAEYFKKDVEALKKQTTELITKIEEALDEYTDLDDPNDEQASAQEELEELSGHLDDAFVELNQI